MGQGISSKMGLRDGAMLVALSILWSGSFFFVAIAVRALPPFTNVALRAPVAAVALWGFIALRRLPIPRSPGATNLSLVTFLIPVSAILLGVTILGERLAMTDIAGMMLIAVGLSAIDGRLWHRRRRH